jgi:hypothetical protein
VRGEKTALLQPDFFIGFANVLFCGLGVVVPNAPLRRKEGEGKIKTSCDVVGILRIYFVFFILIFSRLK